MIFSSADYPIFLIAVFFLYAMAGGMLGGRRLPAIGRMGCLLLLWDLIYLLLSKDLGSLWDPLGALVFRAIAAGPSPPRPPLHYVAGALVFGLGLCLGRRGAPWLASERGQSRLALGSAVLLLGLGATIAASALSGRLELLTRFFAGTGHLLSLSLFGLALGATLREEGRQFGRLLCLFLVSAIFYHVWAAGMPRAYKYLLLLILGTIVLDYYLARWIDEAQRPFVRRALLVVSLVSNLGVLSLFKYFDFFVSTLKTCLGAAGLSLPIEPFALILPAGISFHTFQSLSYTIDVYRRQIPATRSVLHFATFVLFFPQLVAGPIVRAREFMPQLDRPPVLDPDQAARGLFRIMTGLAKKIVLADFLALVLIDRVFDKPTRYSGIEVLCAVYAYAFQIYLDFSAYSDIAIGSAALLGFTLPENFRTPYRSANLQEFWRRWHITLSGWLRDYLYIPLGGGKGPPFLTYRNLLITMLLGGLWHGASWTFIVWGALHGGGLAMTRAFQRLSERHALRVPLQEPTHGALGPEDHPGRRLLLLTLAVAVAGGWVHAGLSGPIGALGARLSFDPAWLHLGLAWAYLTPAWAALTGWLSAAPSSGPSGGPGARGTAALRRAAAALLTFHYVCIGWIFFRAPSFAGAREVLEQIGTGTLDALNLSRTCLVALACASACHCFPDGAWRWLRDGFVRLPPIGKAALMLLLALSLRRLANPGLVPFIYFQF